jgi:ribose-phosphate pyrophosphokinase
VDAIAYYFEGGICPVHVYARDVIVDAARRMGGGDFVLACTDAGRAKWVESLANDMGVTAAFVYKRRLSGDRTEVTGVSAHVRDKAVVIYDDMIRTGGSLLGAARAYHNAGAARVSALTTHGIFPGDALDRLRTSGLITEVVATDTHPRAEALKSDFLKVTSVTNLLVRQLQEWL